MYLNCAHLLGIQLLWKIINKGKVIGWFGFYLSEIQKQMFFSLRADCRLELFPMGSLGILFWEVGGRRIQKVVMLVFHKSNAYLQERFNLYC